HLAQARADDEQHVGVPDVVRNLRIDTDANVGDVMIAAVVEEILAAERRAGREAVRLDPALQAPAGVAVPSAAAQQHERALGAVEQLAEALDLRARRR